MEMELLEIYGTMIIELILLIQNHFGSEHLHFRP
jgi:hypothetical protein